MPASWGGMLIATSRVHTGTTPSASCPGVNTGNEEEILEEEGIVVAVEGGMSLESERTVDVISDIALDKLPEVIVKVFAGEENLPEVAWITEEIIIEIKTRNSIELLQVVAELEGTLLWSLLPLTFLGNAPWRWKHRPRESTIGRKRRKRSLLATVLRGRWPVVLIAFIRLTILAL